MQNQPIAVRHVFGHNGIDSDAVKNIGRALRRSKHGVRAEVSDDDEDDDEIDGGDKTGSDDEEGDELEEALRPAVGRESEDVCGHVENYITAAEKRAEGTVSETKGVRKFPLAGFALYNQKLLEKPDLTARLRQAERLQRLHVLQESGTIAANPLTDYAGLPHRKAWRSRFLTGHHSPWNNVTADVFKSKVND